MHHLTRHAREEAARATFRPTSRFSRLNHLNRLHQEWPRETGNTKPLGARDHIPAIPDGWGGHANIADDESPMISVTDGDSDCESGRETMEMDSHDGLSPIDSTGDADETIFSHAFDPFSDDLPPMPTDPPWTPTKTVAEWTETL